MARPKKTKKTRKPAQNKAESPEAANVRQERDASLVRTYLKSIPEASPSKRVKSIESCAGEWNVPVEQLRTFRDGLGTGGPKALSAGMVTMMAKVLGADAQQTGTINEYETEFDYPRWNTGDIRNERYRQYDLMEECRPEAGSALDAWADLGVVGSAGESPRRKAYTAEYYGKDKSVKQALDDISRQINTFLMPPDVKLQIFRGMGKYGDQWGEIGLARRESGWDMVELAPRPPRTMYVNRQKDGTIDQSQAYVQRLASQTMGQGTTFPNWKIARFANIKGWGDDEGKSLFHSCRAAFVKLEFLECTMLIRRGTRSPMRYHRIIDVGHVEADKRFSVVEEQKKKNTKVRTLDYNQKRGLQSISLPPEEDLYSAKATKDSPAGVEVLQGDAHLGEIDDFVHFFKVWLSGLGPPKAHLGYESDTMRSVITDLHIVFARKVRRMQMRFIAGLNHLYWVGLMLRGIDPRTVDYLIIPPNMGTRDELVRANITQAYATTIKYMTDAFGVTGQVPSMKWFLKYIMGLDEDAIEAMELSKVVQMGPSGAGKNDPPSGLASSEMAAAALGDDAVASTIAVSGFLLGERAMALGVEKVLDMKSHPYAQLNMQPLLNVESAARALGRVYLRKDA